MRFGSIYLRIIAWQEAERAIPSGAGGKILCPGHKISRGFGNDESGISSVEYALLLAVIAAGIIASAGNLSGVVSNQMENAAACIQNGSGC